MLRKQLFVIVLIGLFVLTLGACAKKQTAPVQTAPESATQVTESATSEPAVEEIQETAQPETPAIKIPVLGDVFFEFDKSRLTEEAKQTLAQNAQQLKDAGAVGIAIEGHCDERGTNAYNLALGERRANAARDYLTSLGVDAGRITTISYGEEKPFDSGHDETAWKQNRRAHFVVKQ